jgi:para-nitrobenzyl esterase
VIRVNSKPAEVIGATIHGSVRGIAQDDVCSFRGIPYGDSVDNANRFQAPRPALAWSGVRDTTKTGPRAVQSFGNLFQTRTGDYYTGGRIGELGLNDQVDAETCLVLNVLTRGLDGAKRPVMVYLHGGGFAEGSGVLAVAGQGLVREQDVVLVSVNHRLNAFGFLYLAELDDRYAGGGNAGLLDLVLALEWVRDNIANFGGDPGNVTIFGESGGGGKVSALMAMPAAQGLFRRAIVQSGSIIDAAEPSRGTKLARTLLDRLGVSADSLDALHEIPARSLHDALGDLSWQFRPVVDGINLPQQPFTPEAPAISSGIPLLVGHCEDEMNWLFADDESVFWLEDSEMRERLGSRFMLDASQVDRVVKEYRSERPVASPSALYLRATSDAIFGARADIQAERKSAQPAPVFKYLFTYDTPIEGGRYGAFHTAELPLVFRLVNYPQMEPLSRRISAQWAAFARTGDPSLAGLPWPAFDVANRYTMVMCDQSEVIADPYRSARMLWADLPSIPLMSATRSPAADSQAS